MKLVLEIINEGIESGEFRDDISPSRIRQIILGGIEYLCLPGIISNREIPVDSLADDLFEILFHGLSKKNNS